jgi:hypothetical protein
LREQAKRRQVKDGDEGGGYVDNLPTDELERICVQVEAPGPSLNHISSDMSSKTVRWKKGEVRDCQWWVRQATTALVGRSVLQPLEVDDPLSDVMDPADIVAGLPVH